MELCQQLSCLQQWEGLAGELFTSGGVTADNGMKPTEPHVITCSTIQAAAGACMSRYKGAAEGPYAGQGRSQAGQKPREGVHKGGGSLGCLLVSVGHALVLPVVLPLAVRPCMLRLAVAGRPRAIPLLHVRLLLLLMVRMLLLLLLVGHVLLGVLLTWLPILPLLGIALGTLHPLRVPLPVLLPVRACVLPLGTLAVPWHALRALLGASVARRTSLLVVVLRLGVRRRLCEQVLQTGYLPSVWGFSCLVMCT